MLAADDEAAQAALNVVLEDNMQLGQVLFYCLDRLFLQAGHAISHAAVTVMPASSLVDPEARPPPHSCSLNFRLLLPAHCWCTRSPAVTSIPAV